MKSILKYFKNEIKKIANQNQFIYKFLNTLQIFFLNRLSKINNRNKKYRNWKNKGKTTGAPHRFKEEIIKLYAKELKPSIFIETGTFHGAMIQANKNKFKKLYSIELSEILYKEVKEKFSKFKHINIIHGNSAIELPNILQEINSPCLFWLDAHFSGTGTKRGVLDTPIMQELRSIFNGPNLNHVILIDDAHCFNGINDYPTLKELREFIVEQHTNLLFIVKENIIRIYKSPYRKN